MTKTTPMAGSPGPGSKGAEMTKTDDTNTQPVQRRRGRQPLPKHLRAKPKPRPGRKEYKEVRLKQDIAGIKPKQFFILAQDFDEAEKLMETLIERAKAAYDQVSAEIREATGDTRPAHIRKADHQDQDGEAVKSAPEPEPIVEPEPPKRKPIKERGKLRLKL